MSGAGRHASLADSQSLGFQRFNIVLSAAGISQAIVRSGLGFFGQVDKCNDCYIFDGAKLRAMRPLRRQPEYRADLPRYQRGRSIHRHAVEIAVPVGQEAALWGGSVARSSEIVQHSFGPGAAPSRLC